MSLIDFSRLGTITSSSGVSLGSAKDAMSSVIGGLSSMGSNNLSLNGSTSPYTVTVIRNGNGAEGVPDVIIQAYLPEDFNLDFNSEWSAPFENGIAGNEKVSAVMAVMGYRPVAQFMTSQFWKGSSASDITFPFQFVARNNTYLDVVKPLADLVRLSLPSTTSFGGFFKSPGPRLTIHSNSQTASQDTTKVTKSSAEMKSVSTSAIDAQAKSAASTLEAVTQSILAGDTTGLEGYRFGLTNEIALHIGNTAGGGGYHFESVIIKNVSIAHKSIVDTTSRFMQVTANVTFGFFQTPSAEDILRAFKSQ